jgi:hypothetical protein
LSGADAVVRASVWLAVLCYPAGPAGRLGRLPRLARAAWTAGCLAFLVHVAASFHVHYGWSHTVALRETARQTAELTGHAVGAGLYVNYLFAALWALDALWWWRDPRSHRGRAAAIDLGLHAFLLFVLFNGTVVFARGPVRWLGAAATLAGVATLAAAHARRRTGP